MDELGEVQNQPASVYSLNNQQISSKSCAPEEPSSLLFPAEQIVGL